jgi:hypothetical protein
MKTDPDPGLADWLDRQRPAAAFLRRPEHDADPRAEGDLDLLVFDDGAADLLVERVVPAVGPTLDLLRLPAALLTQPARLAAMGLITHRLMSARCVADRDGAGRPAAAAVAAASRQPEACRSRLASFLELGALAVREVGVTRDWPALARFWLHMAHAAALAALLDGHGRWCPAVYTRPLAAAREAETLLGGPVALPMTQALGLHDDAAALIDPLRTLHARVRQRCPEPHWPAAMPAATRWEYRYWWAPAELNERLAAAGSGPAAVFYLRYVAYSVLRLAMLHQRAREHWPRPIPFLRPETEVRPDLEAHQPDLLPLADAVFGPADSAALDHALDATLALHHQVTARLDALGLGVAAARPWAPHGAAPLPS